MASPHFFKCLSDDLSLELFLQIHLLQTPILFLERLHARHHGNFHAAELGTPLVKRGRAHAKLAT